MAYLVLAYPDIEQSDYDWIQSVRKKEDKRYYGVVDPHFTILFPSNKLNLDDFILHAKKNTGGFQAFEISLDSARVVEDDSKEFFHAFLIPSNGFDEINKLHDALYTGSLESELRHDIPFIPHVGIGTNKDRREIKKLVDDINTSNKRITGSVNKLSVVEYDGKRVVNIQVLPLGK